MENRRRARRSEHGRTPLMDVNLQVTPTRVSTRKSFLVTPLRSKKSLKNQGKVCSTAALQKDSDEIPIEVSCLTSTPIRSSTSSEDIQPLSSRNLRVKSALSKFNSLANINFDRTSKDSKIPVLDKRARLAVANIKSMGLPTQGSQSTATNTSVNQCDCACNTSSNMAPLVSLVDANCSVCHLSTVGVACGTTEESDVNYISPDMTAVSCETTHVEYRDIGSCANAVTACDVSTAAHPECRDANCSALNQNFVDANCSALKQDFVDANCSALKQDFVDANCSALKQDLVDANCSALKQDFADANCSALKQDFADVNCSALKQDLVDADCSAVFVSGIDVSTCTVSAETASVDCNTSVHTADAACNYSMIQLQNTSCNTSLHTADAQFSATAATSHVACEAGVEMTDRVCNTSLLEMTDGACNTSLLATTDTATAMTPVPEHISRSCLTSPLGNTLIRRESFDPGSLDRLELAERLEGYIVLTEVLRDEVKDTEDQRNSLKEKLTKLETQLDSEISRQTTCLREELERCQSRLSVSDTEATRLQTELTQLQHKYHTDTHRYKAERQALLDDVARIKQRHEQQLSELESVEYKRLFEEGEMQMQVLRSQVQAYQDLHENITQAEIAQTKLRVQVIKVSSHLHEKALKLEAREQEVEEKEILLNELEEDIQEQRLQVNKEKEDFYKERDPVQSELDKLRENEVEATQEKERLQLQISQLNEHIAFLDAALERKDTQRDEMEAKLSETEKSLHDSQLLLSEQRQQIDQLKNEVESAASKMLSMNQEIQVGSDAQKDVLTLAEQLDFLQVEQETYKDEISELRKEKMSLEERIDVLCEEGNCLSADLEALRADKLSVNQSLGQYKSELSQANSQIQATCELCGVMYSAVKDLRSQLQHQGEDLGDELLSSFTELEESMRSQGDDMLLNCYSVLLALSQYSCSMSDRLRKELSRREKHIATLNSEVERASDIAHQQAIALQNRLTQVVDERACLQQQLKTTSLVANRAKALESEREALHKQIDFLTSRVQSFQEELKTAAAKVSAQCDNKYTMNNLIMEKVSLNSQVVQLKKEAADRNKHLKEQKETICRRISILEENWKTAEREVLKLDELIQHVREVLTENKDTLGEASPILQLVYELQHTSNSPSQ